MGGVGLVNVDISQILAGAGQFVKDIRTAITGIDPEKKADLEAKLTDFEGKLADYQAQSEKSQYDDRSSARQLGAEYVKAGKTNVRQNILAYLAVFMLGVVIFADLWVAVKCDMTDNGIQAVFALLNMVTGGILKVVNDIYGYDFGGSLESENKTAVISDFMNRARNTRIGDQK
jgi:hypothetical protein